MAHGCTLSYVVATANVCRAQLLEEGFSRGHRVRAHEGCHSHHSQVGDESQQAALLDVEAQRQLEVGRQPRHKRVVAEVEAEVRHVDGPHRGAA